MGILLEIGFCHLATSYGQPLVVVDKLSRFALLVDEEADAQFLSCRKDGLKSYLQAVEVDVVCQGDNTRNIILLYLWIFQAVVKDAQLRLEQWIGLHNRMD